ncbi:MAG: RluA family pseudouridine synthase [Lachnospiraceae bacterium]|nr:RluA family pseudouridine synthase [Lachnospiraceae bacterium]
MRELIVTKKEEGMVLSKYLQKTFEKMPNSILYKLLRKKYFEIEDKKAKGNEILKEGDKIKVFLSDDTYDKFLKERDAVEYDDRIINVKQIRDRIIYEDDNIIVYNKEIGLLSQSDNSKNLSVNSILNDYISSKRVETGFTPSIVNRLDRNTSGLIIFAKTYLAAKEISFMIKKRLIDKRYLAIVNGVMEKDHDILTQLLKKDENNNKVYIKDYKGKEEDNYTKVSLEYKAIKKYKDRSILDIKLITGKSHQIRAQLAHIGHPLIGDKKYMPIEMYKENVKKYGAKTQKLLCYKIKFGSFEDERLTYLNDKEIKLKKEDYEI